MQDDNDLFDVRVSPSKVVQRSGLQSILEIEAPAPSPAQNVVPREEIPEMMDYTNISNPPTYQTLLHRFGILPSRMSSLNVGLSSTDTKWLKDKPHGVVFFKKGARDKHLQEMKVKMNYHV